MFGFSTWELLIVLVVILIVFGAGKLPEVGRTLGTGIRNFQKSLRGDEEEGGGGELPEGQKPKELTPE